MKTAPFDVSPAPQLARLTMDDVRWAAGGGFTHAPEHHVYNKAKENETRAVFRCRGTVDFSFTKSFRAALSRLESRFGRGRVGNIVASATMSNTVMHSTTPAGVCASWFQADGILDQKTFGLTDDLREEVATQILMQPPANAHVRHTIRMPRRGCGKRTLKQKIYHPLQQIMTFGSNARPAHQVSPHPRLNPFIACWVFRSKF